MSANIREIPYNYTSFSDREIVIRLLGNDTWDILNTLRGQRRTGRSAHMLFDILGDMWVIKRNPYIQDDLLDNQKRREALYASFKAKLGRIKERADDNPNALKLIAAAEKSIGDFQRWLEALPPQRKELLKKLNKVTHPHNICFDGLSRVSHVTDASDWRVEYPAVVVTPNNEKEIRDIVDICVALDMNIVPRGGGTGYTGGAVPMTEDSVVINTEKLDHVMPIVKTLLPGRTEEVSTITLGAGVITKQVSIAAEKQNLIFAVDPTSQDSSTIGGNVSTNAGGKKAVMWGTTLDNLASWKMVMPDATWIEVHRLNHNMGKIHDVATSQFEVRQFKDGQQTSAHTITLTAEETRKPGLGKDVTNKILGKLPGVQKEGCDGIITSATFVLHKKFKHTYTLCLEFFNPDMHKSVPAIVDIVALIKNQPEVHLTGLEHLDARYIKAVGYSTKSPKSQLPNMLLLADIACDNEDKLKSITQEVLSLTKARGAEGFVATNTQTRKQFWSDRSRTAAIAAHTNAFKINEDVVIPLDKLAEYSEYIERINIELSLSNKLKIIAAYQDVLRKVLNELDSNDEIQSLHKNKIEPLIAHLENTHQNWEALLNNLDAPITDFGQIFSNTNNGTVFAALLVREEKISLRQEVQVKIDESLNGTQWLGLRKELQDKHQEIRTKRIFVATHMHAGDGNVHTNIPVHSNDYEMLHEADEVVDRIMEIAQDLGGVISGEHGIGLTKIKYLHPENIADFVAYKKSVDINDNFNRGKLTDRQGLHDAYTPSLRLLENEAIILEASELGELNNAVKDCLRCGKCKPVCSTHVPRANLLYSPRNKILATGLLTEAFLYEEQTKRGISFQHFDELNDIADHCTVCHRCLNPCPVNIDFGDVTILIRKLLRKQGKRKFNLGSKVGMFFLNITESRAVNLSRNLMIRFGYKAQSIASKFITHKPAMPNTIGNEDVGSQIVQFLRYPMPTNLPAKTMRAFFDIEDKNSIPIIRNAKTCTDEAVFYFPGCGSERLFSNIGLGVLKWLYELNIQTILPPGYLCCGYPQKANGEIEHADKITTANRVLFHRIAKNVDYLNVTKIVVSCGTCFDQLLNYELQQAFPDAELIDIHELLLEKGVLVDSEENSYLFHDPCHSPTKKHDGTALTQTLLQTETVLSDRCCGESGTFAVARPDIATQVKFRKLEELDKNIADTHSKKILTTCPACLQGLDRLENETSLKADYAMLEMARIRFGENWEKEFIKNLPDTDIERILL